MPNIYNPKNATEKQARAKAWYRLPKATQSVCTDCEGLASEYDHFEGYGENWNKVEPVCRSCHMRREYRRGVRGIRGRQILIGPRMERGYFFTQTITRPGRYGRNRKENKNANGI